MTLTNIRTIINQIGAIHGGGGKCKFPDHPRDHSSEVSAKNRQVPNEIRKSGAAEMYRGALVKIGRPATSKELADATFRTESSIISYAVKNRDFFIITMREDNKKLYWPRNIEPTVGHHQMICGAVDNSRSLAVGESYRQALISIGRPATAREIAKACGKTSASVHAYHKNTPGFFKETWADGLNSRKVIILWIDGL